MSERTLQVSYWTGTLLFSALLVLEGIGGMTQAEAGKEVLQHLGYPGYFLPLAGFAKLLAAVAILQSRFPTLKEWAFAGFAFTCFGAFFSRAAVGDDAGLLALPVISLAIMFVPYVLWKKHAARHLHTDRPISAFSSGTAIPS